MALIPNRDDPFTQAPLDSDIRRDQAFDTELQADPELAEGPASGTRIVLYAVAALAIMGGVFYGLSSSGPSTTASRQNAPVTSTAQSTNPAAPASGPVRDVTPRSLNTAPGVTTGAAPATPATPLTTGQSGAGANVGPTGSDTGTASGR